VAQEFPQDERNIGAVLERMLTERPRQVAVEDASTRLTYDELWRSALAVGGGFLELGLKRQDFGLIMLDDHVDSVLCWLGLCLTGNIEVPVNTAYKGGMLSHIIADCGAPLMIIEAHYLGLLLEVADDIPALRTVVVRGAGAAPTDIARAAALWTLVDLEAVKAAVPAEPAQLDPWDLMSISYTSGTTGRSKGVLCPHLHAFQHAAGPALGDTRPGETRFIVLPQFHIAGQWGGVYNAFICGATAHIAGAFSASTFWEAAARTGATTTELVGTMGEFLWRQPPRPSDRQHSMREVCLLPPPADSAAWEERFGVRIVTCYGSTEIGSVMQNREPHHLGVGRTREGYSVRIVDEHDRELPPGEVGELVVRPDEPWSSSVGYLNNPTQSLEAWRNGWLHSGDALYRDEEGNFFFVDRLDDAIRRRGENISSAEVEHYILTHPAIAEAAAVAVPSEFGEEEIKAVVVLQPDSALNEADLVRFLSKTVPYFMVPRFIEIVEGLPKTPTAKVKKKELRSTGVGDAWDSHAHGLTPGRERRAAPTA
jgi:carnitine-CoA ligase